MRALLASVGLQPTELHGQVAVVTGAGRGIGRAAILCPVAPFSEMSVALWDRVFAVNLRGAFLITKASYPACRQRGGAP